MNILIAIDSFKGTISSIEIGKLLKSNLDSNKIKSEFLSVSDGGEGLIEALKDPLKLEISNQLVVNPLGNNIEAQFGYSNEFSTLVIELAMASGLPLVPENFRNPLNTTTYGCGQLLSLALSKNCKRVLFGVGGSATTDAGTGAMQALGVNFIGASKRSCGRDLINISKIENYQNHWLKKIDFQIACDVSNPFTGSQGSANIYSRQKCAPHLNADQIIEELEKGMIHFKQIIQDEFQIDLNSVAGSGAAGGISGGMHAIFGAKLTPGIQIIFDAIKIEEKIINADLIITGEGRLDHQTLNGKVVVGITNLAKKYKKKVYALCGQNTLTNSEHSKLNLSKVFALIEDSPLEVCLNHTSQAVLKTLQRIKSDLTNSN